MLIDKIKIPKETRDYIQKLDNEIFARKSIIAYLIENNKNIISNEQFKMYQDDYTKYFELFNKAKRDLTDTFIKPIAKSNNFTWHLDYKTCELVINYDTTM